MAEEPKDQSPPSQPGPMSVVLDSGGLKGIAMKFVMYFLMPLIVIIGIGYFTYGTFQKRKFNIEPGHTGNESVPYKDKQVEIQIKVDRLSPHVSEDSDIEMFKQVDEKIKKTYGL